jgi:hypothetical protein
MAHQVDTLSTANHSLDELQHDFDSAEGFDTDPATIEKASAIGPNAFEIVKDLQIRNYCAAALFLSIAVGIVSLVVGCEIVISGKIKLPDFLRGRYLFAKPQSNNGQWLILSIPQIHDYGHDRVGRLAAFLRIVKLRID